MLVFSAITPHPPILIPNIGKDEINKIKKTKEAMERLEQDLYLSKPDTIIVISPHGSLFTDAFSVNAHTNFVSDFEQFGDLTIKLQWKGSEHLAAKLKEMVKDENLPLQLISQEKLDHGTTIPLYYLTQHLPNTAILPIGYSALDNMSHLKFGEMIKELVMETDKRVAIIASGDLSHALTTDAPAGFHKSGQKFDNKIIELLETRNTAGIANLESKLVEESAECGYRSILTLLGILKNIKYDFKNYSYEGPFGVGYLVGNFVF